MATQFLNCISSYCENFGVHSSNINQRRIIINDVLFKTLKIGETNVPFPEFTRENSRIKILIDIFEEYTSLSIHSLCNVCLLYPVAQHIMDSTKGTGNFLFVIVCVCNVCYSSSTIIRDC